MMIVWEREMRWDRIGHERCVGICVNYCMIMRPRNIYTKGPGLK